MLSMRWLARIRQILNGSFQFASVCATTQQSGQTNNTYQQQFFHF